MIRLGIIIPDRGDRPEFLDNCKRMINRQTIKPILINTINHPPDILSTIDITQRYRYGYELISLGLKFSLSSSVDLIAFIENDDWYSPYYLEYMVN